MLFSVDPFKESGIDDMHLWKREGAEKGYDKAERQAMLQRHKGNHRRVA